MRLALHVFALTTIAALAACGGGGGGSAAGGTPSPPPSSASSSSSAAGIPSVDPPGATKIAYGSAPMQFGDLRLPSSATFGPGPYPVAVIVHGGCWTAGVGTKVSTAELADALTRRGIATWNVEYRAIGDSGGGFPGTLLDWSAATDYVRTLAAIQPLDLRRVIVLGHSAGGHAVLWLATRHNLPATSVLYDPAPLPVIAAVDLDGPGELRAELGYNRAMCGNAADTLMGGTPDAVPDRFAQVSPSELLPAGVPQYVVSATFVSVAQAGRYRDMAAGKGDSVTIIDQSHSGHFEMVTPGTPEEAQVEDLIVRLLTP